MTTNRHTMNADPCPVCGPDKTQFTSGCLEPARLRAAWTNTVNAIHAEVIRSRTKFPGRRFLFAALIEKVGELAEAMIDDLPEQVQTEAIQCAGLIVRIIEEGDRKRRDVRRHHERREQAMSEYTLAMIKPDVTDARSRNKIARRITDEGFAVVMGGECEFVFTLDEVAEFYAEHKGRSFFDALCEFMASGPVVPMVLQRDDAIAHWRRVIGATDPCRAESGTIRAQFGNKNGVIYQNAVHGSDRIEAARREISFFFGYVGLRMLGML